MNRKQLKKQAVFDKFYELSDRRFELWFVDMFKCDFDEKGLKVNRELTIDEQEELQQLLVETESLKKEFLSL